MATEKPLRYFFIKATILKNGQEIETNEYPIEANEITHERISELKNNIKKMRNKNYPDDSNEVAFLEYYEISKTVYQDSLKKT